jgi:hypothetical protein
MGATGLGAWRQFPRWVRGPARIEGDEVVLDCGRAEEYDIPTAKDLPFDLAFLAPLSARFGLQLARVVPFVRRYGLLRHGPEESDAGELRERLDDWKEAAAEMAFILEQYRQLREAVRTNSLEPVRPLIDAWSAGPATFSVNESEYLAQLSAVFAERMTAHLQGCTVGMTAAAVLNVKDSRPGRFLVTFHPPDLVAAAYVRLVQSIVSQAPLEECPGCGRIFEPESGKQKYHSKACATTTRGRRWRAQQAK